MNPLLLTVSQAADTLGLSRSKTYELIQRGDLHSVVIGRCRRVPTASLNDFIESLSPPRTTTSVSVTVAGGSGA